VTAFASAPLNPDVPRISPSPRKFANRALLASVRRNPIRPKPVVFIAEAGVNHNGDVSAARNLIEVAANAGADIVKFQSFTAANLAAPRAQKAPYQVATTGDDSSQLEMLRGLELSDADHLSLSRLCEELGIEFLSTPFDVERLNFLVNEAGVRRIKLGSSEVTHGALLLAAARTGLPILLSTGMSTLGEIEDALAVIAYGSTGAERPRSLEDCREALTTHEGWAAVVERVTLLHCNTAYPTAYEDVHLRAMSTLADAFGTEVGYSDHTEGGTASLAATALGAAVIEKHFTTDRSLPGPDHGMSMEAEGLKSLIKEIRWVTACLGEPQKAPRPSEFANREVARRSLHATRSIRTGEILSEPDLAARRPADGMSPMRLWDLLGQPCPRDIEENEQL
jgi:N-acetylneuraminate synthase